MKYDLDEVERAFRKYWALGAVGEDWDAWCDSCFTEDVTYEGARRVTLVFAGNLLVGVVDAR